MHDLGPERQVIVEWPERERQGASRDLLLRSYRFVRSKHGTVRQRLAGPKVRRASVDFGSHQSQGYRYSENYVAQSYNSTAWYIGGAVLLLVAIVVVASRTGGLEGLRNMVILFVLVSVYRFYRRYIKPKVDVIVHFLRQFH